MGEAAETLHGAASQLHQPDQESQTEPPCCRSDFGSTQQAGSWRRRGCFGRCRCRGDTSLRCRYCCRACTTSSTSSSSVCESIHQRGTHGNLRFRRTTTTGFKTTQIARALWWYSTLVYYVNGGSELSCPRTAQLPDAVAFVADAYPFLLDAACPTGIPASFHTTSTALHRAIAEPWFKDTFRALRNALSLRADVILDFDYAHYTPSPSSFQEQNWDPRPSCLHLAPYPAVLKERHVPFQEDDDHFSFMARAASQRVPESSSEQVVEGQVDQCKKKSHPQSQSSPRKRQSRRTQSDTGKNQWVQARECKGCPETK